MSDGIWLPLQMDLSVLLWPTYCNNSSSSALFCSVYNTDNFTAPKFFYLPLSVKRWWNHFRKTYGEESWLYTQLEIVLDMIPFVPKYHLWITLLPHCFFHENVEYTFHVPYISCLSLIMHPKMHVSDWLHTNSTSMIATYIKYLSDKFIIF